MTQTQPPKGRTNLAKPQPRLAVLAAASADSGLRSALLGGVSLLAIATTMLPGVAQADVPSGATCIGTQYITTPVGPLTDANGGNITIYNNNNTANGRVTGAGNGPGILLGDCGGSASIVNAGGTIFGNTGVQINVGALGGMLTNAEGTYVSGTVVSTYYGTIWGSATSGVQVDGSLGTLSNQFGSNLIYGAGAGVAVSASGHVGQLDNSGDIFGSQRGIRNAGLIDQVNNWGTISGTNVGLRNDGTIGTLANAGQLFGFSQFGNGLLNTGVIGSVTNTGTIAGASDAGGLLNQGSITQLTNSGLIIGLNIALGNEGSIGLLDNQFAGTIIGTHNGISNSTLGRIDTLVNAGQIWVTSGSSAAGIRNAGLIGSLTNSGTILAPGGGGYEYYSTGIWNSSTGTIGDLLNSGSIGVGGVFNTIGYATGITNEGLIRTLTSSGSISAYGSDVSGIWNRDGASIGLLTNSGSIYARGSYHAGGIANEGVIGTLINSGVLDIASSIYAGTFTGYATGIYNSGSITSLLNSGTIAVAGASGVGVYNDSIGQIGQLTNTGTIAVNAYSGYGVLNYGTIGSLTNSGLIVVGNETSPEGVSFSNSTGIANAGLIGTLVNSGTIIVGEIGSAGTVGYGFAAGIMNAGSITGLLNDVSGTILAFHFGSAAGILNEGMINTVDNRGGILALAGNSAAGIFNNGTIGTLTNSGMIASEGFAYGSIVSSIFSNSITNVVGIGNAGTIGSLLNSGTIIAVGIGVGELDSIGTVGVAGIYNTGLIDRLDNSGTILAFGVGSSTIHAIGIMNGDRSFIERGAPAISTSSFDTIATIGTLTNSGTIIAFRSGSIGSATGVVNVGRIGLLQNTGLIAAQDVGITNALGSIGTLDNSASGMILGGTIGVAVLDGAVIDVLNNRGTIVGGTIGIYSGYGRVGLLDNAGTIFGGVQGISLFESSIGTLANSGSIIGGTTGVQLSYSTIGTLANSGTITGASYGMYMSSGSIGTLTNSGSIVTPYYAGIYVSTGNIGVLNNSGLISAGSYYGIENFGTIGVLTNSGTISGGSSGIYTNGSIGTLSNSGTIYGGSAAVTNYGMVDTLTNSGQIIGGGYGIYNYGKGGTIGLLSNTGTGVISGSTGIYNSGNIGTLTNAGTIAGSIALRNMGTIGLLSNSNSITGSATGIHNTGSIIGLSNSGTIAGSIYALYSSGGGLSAVNNSGIINGNILVHDQNVTINGSNNSVFGALVNGNTTITNGNLTFDTGNLYLAHNVTVNGGSGTVFNNANVLVTAAQSITGNYVQSTGGLLTVGIGSLSSYGRLNVSGTVNMANSNVLILPLNGFKLPAGSQYVLVDSATPAGTSYAGVQHVLQGYNSTITSTIINGHYDLILTAFTPITNNTRTGVQSGQYQGPVGSTLDTINNQNTFAASAFYNAVLRYIDALPSGSAQQHAVVQTGPVQINPLGLTFQVAAPIVQNFEQHQLGFGALAQGNSRNGVSAGSSAHNLSIWMQAMGGFANRANTSSSDGYHASHGGVMFGTDWKPSPNLLVGAGFATVFGRATASGITTGSNTSVSSYQLVGYSTYRFMPNTFAYGQVGGGVSDFTQNRRIGFLGTTARSKYTGNSVTAKVGVGHDIALPASMTGMGMGMDLTLTPLVGVTFIRANTGSYAETGAGLANLTANSASSTSVTTDVGARIAGQVQTSIGLIRPELRLAWLHEFDNSRLATSGQLYNTGYAVTNRRIAPNGVRVNLAATLIKSDALTIRAEYEGDIRSGYSSHSGLVRAALGF